VLNLCTSPRKTLPPPPATARQSPPHPRSRICTRASPSLFAKPKRKVLQIILMGNIYKMEYVRLYIKMVNSHRYVSKQLNPPKDVFFIWTPGDHVLSQKPLVDVGIDPFEGGNQLSQPKFTRLPSFRSHHLFCPFAVVPGPCHHLTAFPH
jgi:hypothetical protein